MDNLSGKQASERNVTLDVCKGILIILVVIRHVLQYSVTDEGGILTNLIWAVQMPGFMFVSGYFGAKTINGGSELKKSIQKSTERYLLPFFSWWILISVLLLGRFNHNPVTGLSVLVWNVDGGLWFLWVVFVLSIIFAFCNLAFTKGKSIANKVALVAAVGASLCLVLIVVAKIAGINLLGIKYILYYAVFYGFGWLVHSTEDFWKQRFTDRLKHHVLLVCFVVYIAICYNYDLYRCDDDIISILLRLIVGLTGNAVLLGVVGHFKIVLANAK